MSYSFWKSNIGDKEEGGMKGCRELKERKAVGDDVILDLDCSSAQKWLSTPYA